MADADRLPRGRHRLSRAEVAGSQRARMLRAMADAMTEKGYVGTTVADIIGRAGVSRETFYQQFSSKADCFAAAFDAAGQVLFSRLDDSPDRTGTAVERFDRALAAYLDALATHPADARLFLVEVHAAGPEAVAHRAALQDRIAERLVTLLDVDTDHGRFACHALVAAIGAMVAGPLVAGDVQAIRDLRPRLVDLVERALATG